MPPKHSTLHVSTISDNNMADIRTCEMSATCFFSWLDNVSGPGPPVWVPSITMGHTKLSKTPPVEWSARRRDLYLTKHNTHNRQTSMPSEGFDPAIPANERP